MIGEGAKMHGTDIHQDISNVPQDEYVAMPTIVSTPVTQTPLPSGQGTIYTFSVMYNVPQGYEEQKPYIIAIIQLDDGPKITAQLTDVEQNDVAIGMRVEMVTRKLREEGQEGQIIYGYKFRPLLLP